jgi:HK97 family phage prohead protease
MDRLHFAFDLKAVSEIGVFEGYASTFGNRDQGGDIVEAGAFAKSIKTRGPRGIKMLADHDATKRIGVWTDMEEDANGLYVKGQLLTEKTLGQEAYIDLKAGALSGLSIGGRASLTAQDGRKRARMIKEWDLYEISLVTFPMNESATVTGVKELSDMLSEDWREIEAALRTKGLSRADAVKAVSGFKDYFRRDAGKPETALRDEEQAAIADLIRANIATITVGGRNG